MFCTVRRYEARNLPSVVMAESRPENQLISETSLPDVENRFSAVSDSALADCPQELLPSELWIRAFLSNFSELRRRLKRESDLLSGKVDEMPVRIRSRSMLPQHLKEELYQLELNPPSLLMPELHDLVRIDQINIAKRIIKASKKLDSADTLDESDAANLYALSARIERPLHGDVAAAYRAILRKCCRLRAAVRGCHDLSLPHLNIIIVISGAYFGQDEMLASYQDEDLGDES